MVKWKTGLTYGMRRGLLRGSLQIFRNSRQKVGKFSETGQIFRSHGQAFRNSRQIFRNSGQIFKNSGQIFRESANFQKQWTDLRRPWAGFQKQSADFQKLGRFSVNSSAFHPLERKCLPCPTWTTSQTHAWRRQLTQPRKSLLTIEFKTVDSYSFKRLYLTCHLHVPNTKNNGTFTPIKKRLHNAINRADYWLR